MEVVIGKYSPHYGIVASNAPIFNKRYRSSFEIVALILEVACEGASRFTLANRLHTNYLQIQRYLDYLIKMRFIDVESNGKRILYKTSKKGVEFLSLYRTLVKMFPGAVEAKAPLSIVVKSE